MSNKEAMRLPLLQSVMLLSLFMGFKFLPKDSVNSALTYDFVVFGIFALSYASIITSTLI